MNIETLLENYTKELELEYDDLKDKVYLHRNEYLYAKARLQEKYASIWYEAEKER